LQILTLTPRHVLFDPSFRPLRAEQLRIGDTLLNENGTASRVMKIEYRTEMARIEVIAQAGNLIVNEMVASCFDTNHLRGIIYNYNLWTLNWIGGVWLLNNPLIKAYLDFDLAIGETALAWVNQGTPTELLFVPIFALAEILFETVLLVAPLYPLLELFSGKRSE